MMDSRVEQEPRNTASRKGVESLLAIVGSEDFSWHLLANCRDEDPDIFFPVNDKAKRAAKKICLLCPVSADCLQYAMEANEPIGVWGAYDERQRRVLAREKRGHRR